MNQNNMDDAILAGQLAKRQQIKKVSVGLLAFMLFAGASWGIVTWINGATNAQSPAAQHGEASDNSPADGTELRNLLQKQLANADATLSEVEAHTGKQHWNRDGIIALRNQLQLTYGHYSAEEYIAAKQQIEALQTAVKHFEQGHLEAWNGTWRAASVAFKEQEITSARLHNQQTLTLNPGYEPAMALQQKLHDWDELLVQREALRVAEIENNVPKQIASLEKLVQLATENLDYPQKLAALLKTEQDNAFAASLQRAISALESGQLEVAQGHLDKAQSIDPNRHEVAHIQSQLTQQKQLKSEARFQQQMSVMATVDNWPAVLNLSKRALQAHPKNSLFTDYSDKATQILALNQQVNGYLARPDRLNDANIASNAAHLLTHNQHWFQESPSLSTLAQQLDALLQHKNQPLDVVIYSDGKTDIRVLGTGVVGKVQEKRIQLLPGSYRLEGRRPGYQSKIVTLTVQAGNDPLSVNLVCDEKI